jgi:hypothetical protein
MDQLLGGQQALQERNEPVFSHVEVQKPLRRSRRCSALLSFLLTAPRRTGSRPSCRRKTKFSDSKGGQLEMKNIALPSSRANRGARCGLSGLKASLSGSMSLSLAVLQRSMSLSYAAFTGAAYIDFSDQD